MHDFRMPWLQVFGFERIGLSPPPLFRFSLSKGNKLFTYIFTSVHFLSFWNWDSRSATMFVASFSLLNILEFSSITTFRFVHTRDSLSLRSINYQHMRNPDLRVWFPESWRKELSLCSQTRFLRLGVDHRLRWLPVHAQFAAILTRTLWFRIPFKSKFTKGIKNNPLFSSLVEQVY